MTDKQKVKLQKWWLDNIRDLTDKVIAQEERRQERVRKKSVEMFGDLEITRREDIDDLYGYGVISESKRDKLVDLWEKGEQTDDLYEAKLNLLQEEYAEAKRILQELGQVV